MLPEPNRNIKITPSAESVRENASLYSNQTEELWKAPSSPSSGTFSKLVRETAADAGNQPAPKMRLFNQAVSASYGESLGGRSRSGKSTTSLRLKIYKQTVSSFLNMANQDLREPLTILTTGLAILKRQADETNKQLIEEMERALNQATGVIGTYLETNRSRPLGRLEVHYEDIGLYEIVEGEIARMAEIFPGDMLSRIRLRNFVTPQTRIWADKAKFRQILALLLGHAVRQSLPTGSISVEHHSTDKEDVIEISDRGRGLGDETLKALASPFLDSMKHARLDLQAAQRLIEAHQGKLRIHSHDDSDNQILVVLPKADCVID